MHVVHNQTNVSVPPEVSDSLWLSHRNLVLHANCPKAQWRRLSLEASLLPARLGELTLRATLLTRLWLPQVELAILASTELCSRQGPLAYLARERLRGCLAGSLLVHSLISRGLSFGTCRRALLACHLYTISRAMTPLLGPCLLYTSDAADE